MGLNMTDKATITDQLLTLPVEDQFKIASRLAANCGYRLVGEIDEKHLQIRAIITRIERNNAVVKEESDRALIKEGLEKLL